MTTPETTPETTQETTLETTTPETTTSDVVEVISKFSEQKEETPSVSDDWKTTYKKNDLYFGKYKTEQDVYKALEHAQNKLNEKYPEVPEQYDLTTAFTTAGMTPLDKTQYQEIYSSFEEGLKSNNFTNKQLDFMLEWGNKWVNQQVQEHGSSFDKDAERAKLSKEWGDATEQRATTVISQAALVLPADVVRSLYSSAEGIKFLDKYLQSQKGSVPFYDRTGDSHSTQSLEDLKLEEANIRQDPEYFAKTPKSKVLQNKMYDLTKKIMQMEAKAK